MGKFSNIIPGKPGSHFDPSDPAWKPNEIKTMLSDDGKYWTTKDGTTIKITEIEQVHLENIAKMLIKMEEAAVAKLKQTRKMCHPLATEIERRQLEAAKAKKAADEANAKLVNAAITAKLQAKSAALKVRATGRLFRD